MAKKDKRATDQLNIALSGIDAALSILDGLVEAEAKPLLERARKCTEQACGHLITIKKLAAGI